MSGFAWLLSVLLPFLGPTGAHVVDARGVPVADARVVVTPAPAPAVTPIGALIPATAVVTTTDAAGRLREPLPAYETALLEVHRPFLRPWRRVVSLAAERAPWPVVVKSRR